jgi:hypothetical protein
MTRRLHQSHCISISPPQQMSIKNWCMIKDLPLSTIFPPLRPERAKLNVLLGSFHSHLLQNRPLYGPGSWHSDTPHNYYATMSAVPHHDEVNSPQVP